MIRVALIGAGNHSALNHGPSLSHCAADPRFEVTLAAVCDLDENKAKKYASSFGFARTYTAIGEMLERESIDAVVAVTPVQATRPVVEELLGYKIPLHLEKPPGRNAKEADELVSIAEKTGTRTMVSLNRRFVPAVRKAVEWIRDQTPPRLLIARMLRSSRLEDEFVTGTGIHLVDTVLSLMGAPADIESHRWATSAGGQSCDGRIRFENGSSAAVIITPDSGIEGESYELLGDGYTVRIESLRNQISIYRDEETIFEWQIEKDTPTYITSGCLAETEAFLNAVAGTSPFCPTLQEGAISLKTAEALDRGGHTDS